MALGSDTGGSVRIPSACCGTAGLKTTYGRVPAAGVWPLAPSLDTVGPMAATVDGLITGMRLLEPGFTVAGAPARTIGRLRTSGHPEIEAAIDRAQIIWPEGWALLAETRAQPMASRAAQDMGPGALACPGQGVRAAVTCAVSSELRT